MPLFRALCRFALTLAGLGLVASVAPEPVALTTKAVAQTADDAAEKDAFESAKELGTADAWQAFLKNYQTGFRADLARAYLKKLGDGQATVPAAATSAPANAEEISCEEAQALKSKESSTAARITFVNKSGATRVIQWKTFDGGYKEYATLEPGQEFVQETFLTHPWIAVNGPGDCANAFLPVPGNSIAVLHVTNDQMAARQRDDYSEHGPTPEQSCRDAGMVYGDGVCVAKSNKKESEKKSEKSARKSCAELDMDYRGGQCVAKYKKDKERLKKQKKKGCPKGTYLNPLGVCQPNETGG
ncbi:MAG: hypothetical protein IKE66_11505 [Hyphomicrobium sp.]|nr:hypothetical protein [Hyphomicrobium sp.]